MLRVQKTDVVCETFEAGATNAAIMSCSRLVRTFPGPCTKFPRSTLHNPYFREQLSLFLSDMNREALDGSAAHTRKAGSSTLEIRDTAHPRYITDLLMSILVATGGEENTFQSPARTVTKHIAEDVLWNKAYAPWRRSQLWLVIRVAIQTSLPDVGEYKSFVLFLLAAVGHQVAAASSTAFDMSLLECIRKKIGRRAAKLHGSYPDAPAFVFKEARLVCESITRILEHRWSAVQRNTTPKYDLPWAPKELDVAADTRLPLESSSPVIEAALRSVTDSQPAQPAVYVPPTVARLRTLSLDTVIEKRGLESTPKLDYEGRTHSLLDFETMVGSDLESWTAGQADASRLSNLVYTMKEYYIAANRHYSGNAEAQSRMILTVLELWVAIDKIATTSIPLLLKYPPEITTSLIDPLLLRTRSDLARARALTLYLDRRRTNGTGPSVFAAPSSAAFSVRYFDATITLKHEKRCIEECAQKQRQEKVVELERMNEAHVVWTRSVHDRNCTKKKNTTCAKCVLKVTIKSCLHC